MKEENNVNAITKEGESEQFIPLKGSFTQMEKNQTIIDTGASMTVISQKKPINATYALTKRKRLLKMAG